jgi:predicted RecB family nuclease
VYLDEGTLTVSPTDLTKFLGCSHATALDHAVAQGTRSQPVIEADEALELLFRRGTEHEERHLTSLRTASTVVVIGPNPVSEAASATERAMREGAEVIHQATFLHEGRRGHADFLMRTDRPSGLGNWSYDVADTKLARRLKVPALLQMAEYGEHLRRIQGVPPTWLTVVAGDGVEHPYRYADVENYHRHLAGRFGTFLGAAAATVAQPVALCSQCRWNAQCSTGWRNDDHLSLVAFLRTDHRQSLQRVGITTVAALAAADPGDLPRDIGRSSRERLHHQAKLQMRERTTGAPTFELLPPAPSMGLQRLPEPDAGDLYLDFEGDPYVEPAGREYLAGVGDRTGAFEPFWAHSVDEEAQLTADLVDRLLLQLENHPGMHVYHYAPYERSALQRLTARHGVREAELDVLLRAEVLVDLYAVVRQGVRISKESYSIKQLEAFYWGHTRSGGDVADAMSSVVAYERWLIERDDATLEQIRAYNEDDVRSTLALHHWLEERRAELAASDGPLERPLPGKSTESLQPNDAERAETALADRLLDQGHTLMAGLVGWHRREQRPAWWDVYRVEDLDDDELVDDGSAIGELGAPVWVRDVKRSQVNRYPFPPQDTKVRVGDDALDVDSHKSVGRVVAFDVEEGWIELSLGKGRDVAQPRGVSPKGPINDGVLRSAVADVGSRLLSGSDCLGGRLLRREVPVALPQRDDETAAEAVVRIGSSLGGGVLAVQGPPGTGKSTAGAELIRSLLDAGLKVGITALSHQVIGNLLAKVDRPALQKCGPDSAGDGKLITLTDKNPAVADALATGTHRLVGGTAWLWAAGDLRDAVDVLVIDEAGQFSLANAVAVSRAARSMVLLGDPQQLSQPSQAQHPHGAGVSALEHLLDGHETVPADRGVFLDTTWRMHPQITSFVSVTSYEDRLHAAPGLEHQRLIGTGGWSGSGLRWLPVVHEGDQSASTEEAGVVADVVAEILAGSWVGVDGVEKPMTPDQVLVVAPYNAQVARLRQTLPAAVRVGTVDKFQGREAAVVIYSLASSSAEDAPRGVDFLYDLHRLNVAVSRARAMTVVVASPELLNATVHNPEQLRLVNALCRYAETASSRPA